MDLKIFRQRLGLSQRELSEKLNIPITTLFSYETNVNKPNIETLIKMADFYHVSLDELVGRPTSLINKLALSERVQNIIECVIKMNDKQQELTQFYIDTLMKGV